MGKEAIAEHKLEEGNPLGILGVSTRLDESGISCTPDPAKVEKWLAQIDAALYLGS